MALLKITDASGRQWEYNLMPQAACTIGRAPDNCVVLDDPRASRHHAHIKFDDPGYTIVDGVVMNGQVRRSANKVFVNGEPSYEHTLKDGDRVTIGASTLRFEQQKEERTTDVRYDDKPLGHTQLLISANDVMSTVLRTSKPPTAAPTAPSARDKEMEALQRKANILAELYEMSKTLGSVFDLNAIFAKATDIIFRSTPADRVVALLAEGSVTDGEDVELVPIATRARDEKLEAHAKKLTIGRTITRKVMKDRVALLSQDAAAEAMFAGVESIVSQGVRSTICAPLVAESGVHGALYADRLDPFAAFKPDDLELITAVAAQTAVAVENARAHERLAREEVARANYGRFLPEYVVKQMLENPESFKLGGSNQIITVLFADIRGFTRISEHASPEKVVQLLNKYFSAMTDIIFAHGGTLDKYLGDGLMALFGAPTATPQDATNAVNAAVAMQRRVIGINQELRAEGLNEIGIGIGLHTGEATVGYIGSERRSEYTAIGDTVNTASRLESNSKAGQILLSDATARAAASRYPLQQRDPIYVKNRAQPVPLFEIEWESGKSQGDPLVVSLNDRAN
jgi:adenylate cyclase